MTLTEVLNKYDEAAAFFLHELEAQHRSEETIKNHVGSLGRFRDFFIRFHEDEDDVSDPKYLDFQTWRDELEAEGKASSSITIYLNNLRQFFACVSDEELEDIRFYDRNPVPKRIIPGPGKEAKKPYEQFLTDEQIARLWENNPQWAHTRQKPLWARNYAIIMILLATEIRSKEILDLKVSDVDFEYGEIQVWSGKGDKYRCVDCPDIALDAVSLYLRSGIRPEGLSDDDYLFGNTRVKGHMGKPVYGDEWHRGTKQWLADIVKKHVKMVTGVDRISPHDLRHVGARLDLHNGMRAEELQAKLGHEALQTTQIYSGKLGTKRRRVSAKGVYAERDYQAQKTKRMLEAV